MKSNQAEWDACKMNDRNATEATRWSPKRRRRCDLDWFNQECGDGDGLFMPTRRDQKRCSFHERLHGTAPIGAGAHHA